jgi:hypothetical protein
MELLWMGTPLVAMGLVLLLQAMESRLSAPDPPPVPTALPQETHHHDEA